MYCAKDLAASQPQKLAEMQAVFDGEARKNNIYPLDDRFAFTRGVDSAIAKGQHRNSYRYRGKDVSVALYAAPALGLRSFKLTAHLDVTEPNQTGVLVASGSWFGGWSFYLKDGRPTVLESVSQKAKDQFRVGASEALPPGPATIVYEFIRDDASLRGGGTMRILVDDREVGSGRIDRTILRTAGLGETFDLGRDTGVPVTDDYVGSGAFAGEIREVRVEIEAPVAAVR